MNHSDSMDSVMLDEMVKEKISSSMGSGMYKQNVMPGILEDLQQTHSEFQKTGNLIKPEREHDFKTYTPMHGSNYIPEAEFNTKLV